MKIKLFTFILFILFGFISCSDGNQGEEGTLTGSDEGYGTMVGNPGYDFEMTTAFPQLTALTPQAGLTGQESESVSKVGNPAVKLWYTTVVNGEMTFVTEQLNQLDELGNAIITAWEQAGKPSGESTTTLTLDMPTRVGRTFSTWDVDFGLEAGDEDYYRMDFKNKVTGEQESTYVVKFDDAGHAVRGLWVYVNPNTLATDSVEKLQTGELLGKPRLISLAFDTEDSAKPVFMMRVEVYSENLGYFITYHLHSACEGTRCTAEFLGITSEPPLRKLTKVVHFDWETETEAVCVGVLTYKNGVAEFIDETMGFVGLYPATDTEITADCVMATSFPWAGATYAPSYLPIRVEDDYDLSTALVYSKDWHAPVPAQIDAWLKATSF